MSDVAWRTLDIFIRDRAGDLIPGVDISFSFDGQTVGHVDGAEGRGRIELSSANSKSIDVAVRYKGEEQKAKIPSDQKSYIFVYDTLVRPPMEGKNSHIALWVGLGLTAVALGLAFTFPDPKALQIKLIQGLFALGLGGFATELTGFLKVDMTFDKRLAIGAGGALAVFVILWFTNAKI